MSSDKETLYQFVPNTPAPKHTLQIFLSRDEAYDLIASLLKQLKSNDDSTGIELVGRMSFVPLDVGGQGLEP